MRGKKKLNDWRNLQKEPQKDNKDWTIRRPNSGGDTSPISVSPGGLYKPLSFPSTKHISFYVNQKKKKTKEW